MKRILVFMLCLLLIGAIPIVASAAEVSTDATEVVEEEMTVTEEIVDYVKNHVEEISVIVTLILGIFYEVRKHGKLNGSIGLLNNNAIAVAQNSAETARAAFDGIRGVADVVSNYKVEFEAILSEWRKTEEEKKTLEYTLNNAVMFINTSKQAMIELSNEVAELLVLANIPNSKKEELYSRHRAAVDAIAVAEGEVTTHDGEEA